MSRFKYMYIFSDMVGFGLKGSTVPLAVNQGDACVIPLPHISSFPLPSITWLEITSKGYKNFSSQMTDESLRHMVTINKSLVLLDRKMYDSWHSFQPEARNGYTNASAAKGPAANVSVHGKYLYCTPEKYYYV